MGDVAVQKYRFQRKSLRYYQYHSSRAQRHPIVVKNLEVVPRTMDVREMFRRMDEQAKLAIERAGGVRRVETVADYEQRKAAAANEEALAEQLRVRNLRHGSELDLSALQKICEQVEALQAEREAREDAESQKRRQQKKLLTKIGR